MSVKKKAPGISGREVTVTVGTNVRIHPTATFGTGVVLGDNVTIGRDSRIGDDVGMYFTKEVGTYTVVHSGVKIGRAKIGWGGEVGTGAAVHDYSEVGPGVKIGADTIVRSRVIIPDDWEIPANRIVNPGPDGVPVIILRTP